MFSSQCDQLLESKLAQICANGCLKLTQQFTLKAMVFNGL